MLNRAINSKAMIAHRAKLRKLGFIELPSTETPAVKRRYYLIPNIGLRQALAKANRIAACFFRL
jgi:hypothetical protein